MQNTEVDTATTTVFARCGGDHDRTCAWHAVMAVAENATESGYDAPELVENALDLIPDYCHCN